MEIERKFLVRWIPPDNAITKCEILRQGYLVIDDKKVSAVRIRQEGDRCTLTAKAEVPGLGMIARHEAEIPLAVSDFETLWPLTAGSRVAKTRHYLPLTAHLVATVDLFDHGLQLVEVEFQTIEDADAFQPPDWFGREVTHDPQFTNTWIARYGNPLHLQGSTHGHDSA
jgi:adenylate cyclase